MWRSALLMIFCLCVTRSAFAAQYWYYCDNPAGYYPYVHDCKTQWREVDAAAETERLREEAAAKAEKERQKQAAKAKAAELAAAKAAGYKTVEEYHAVQEAARQKKEQEEREAAAEAERQRQAAAELKAAQAAGYDDVSSYRAAMADRAALARQATPVTYGELARNPTQHMGQVVHFTGRVAQVEYQGDEAMLRVEMTRTIYGWADAVLCDYHPVSTSAPRILEGDVVQVWGISQGITSYTSIFGQTIQVPKISARYLQYVGGGPS
jgi:hypothetical protein